MPYNSSWIEQENTSQGPKTLDVLMQFFITQSPNNAARKLTDCPLTENVIQIFSKKPAELETSVRKKDENALCIAVCIYWRI